MDLLRVLTNIGLSTKEAQIYLVLLKLKEALPGIISRQSGVKRPTTYLILEQLVKKGLASKVKKGTYYHFQPVSPYDILDDQYKKYQDLDNAIPEFLSIHRRYENQPQVSYFEGKKGLIRIMDDTLTTSTELLCWADASLATSTVLKDYYPSYVKTKVDRKIWLRGIFSYDREALKLKKCGEVELREIYLIPNKEFPFANEVNIYDDKVAIVSHQDEFGVIIRNQNIADTQRSIFNFAFKYAKLTEKNLLTEEDLKYLSA